MGIQEILQSQGLSAEQVDKIIGEMKQNKVYTASEENLDIRFNKLKTDHEGQTAELEKANGLIAELQKAAKGNEDMQGKIAAYEREVAQLRAELDRTKLDAAIKVNLLDAKALDVDYLTFKLREKGELALDENGGVKGWDDKLAALKTQFPGQFEGAARKKVDENKLPDAEEGQKPLSKSDVLKMPYKERAELFAQDQSAYNELMKG